MKILLYESYPNFVSREKAAFEELGHTVTVFNSFNYKIKNKIANRLARYLPDNLVYDELNSKLLEVINSQFFDLMMVYYGKEIRPDALYHIKSRIPLLVNWNGDDLFNGLNNNRYLIDSIPIYDFHCSPRHHLKKEYLSKGVKNFIEVDWYYKSILENLIKDKPIYNGNFIGSWSPKRESFISNIMDNDLLVYGWGWTRKSNCINKKLMPLIAESEMNKIFSQSKISINILTNENRDSINFRNYEIPSQCGFQISERSARILEVFEEGVNIVCFETPEELNDKYNYYLKKDSERMKIIENSFGLLNDKGYNLKNQLTKVLSALE